MCEFCEGKTPLTNKVYDDGSKFDDSQSTRIEYMGKMPTLVSEVKEKHFNWTFIKNKLTDEQIKFCCDKWAVVINFCPICGEKLQEVDK